MIKNVSELLGKIADEENKKLKEFNISHGPTIGDMYEGLTADILNRAIPDGLGLQIVDGFVTDDSGKPGHQIDCMLVRGSGEKIPYTDSFVWHIRDVIAVFEVKKTLYSADYVDSYDKLRDVLSTYSNFTQATNSKQVYDIGPAQRAFAQLTGRIAPAYQDVSQLPFNEEMIYRSLIIEQISPVRIAFGYNGYASERAFRTGVRDYHSLHLGEMGFGVCSFPQLSVSGRYSLLKVNGLPYNSIGLVNGYWPFLVSSRANPLRLLLELVWTRLVQLYALQGLWGEDLDGEGFSPCLNAKAIQDGTKAGWAMQFVPISTKALENAPVSVAWQPCLVSPNIYGLFELLCGDGFLTLDDGRLRTASVAEGVSIEALVKILLGTGLVALEENRLELSTEELKCVILPDGRYAVADDATGRFQRWVNRECGGN